jgi:broad specificity phosphatase PhoE
MWWTAGVLILVRHGRTAANRSGLLQGHRDLPLDELGRAQARACATAVGAEVPVITSPLARALATGQAINPEVTIDERWIEFDYGEYDGLPIGDLPPGTWDAWHRNTAFAPPGGESLLDLDKRVRAACEELRPIAAERDVVVVSHVGPIKSAVAWALDVGVEISWRCHLDVASLCRIDFTARGPMLRSFNDTAHLRDLDLAGAPTTLP